ncbi:MAG: GntR family transcriptional regulator [Lachnospiraceae bacterium]|nr:GntR family transcriptional regulator [Lachnospiraceae bacterium]
MITLDYRDKRPIYEQIIEQIQKLIVSEVFKPNEKIPSVRSLAMEISINPNTIQRAYMQLEKDGWIYTVKGKGNFVSEKSGWLNTEKIAALESLKKEILKAKALGISREEIIELL